MAYHNLNGSANKFVAALSPIALAVAGSTNAVDFSDFTHITYGVISNSESGSLDLLRSATSNGTFAAFGASLTTKASGIRLRTANAQSSAVWYKVSYDNNNAGSIINAIFVIGQGSRKIPVGAQHANTSVYSDVA
jgi:hypothetical protein